VRMSTTNGAGAVNTLTDLDRRLISELQVDGRTPFGTLATTLGASEATVQRRVQQLIDLGYFKIVGTVDPLRITEGHAVIVGLQCEPQAAHDVATAVAGIPEMRFVSVVTGTYDIVCELVTFDRLTTTNVLLSTLGAISGIRDMNTSRVLANYKTNFRWDTLHTGQQSNGHVPSPERRQEPEERLSLDSLDEGIVRLLEEDGRMTYQHIADRLDTTISTARRRSLRLLQSGYVTVIALGNPLRLGFDEVVLFWLRVDLAHTLDVIHALEQETCIRYLSRMAGSVDVLAEAFFPHRGALLDFLDGPLSRIEGIRQVALSFELVIRKRGYTLFE
jgi:DNA-binding Lrp family transcriptional regulator